jgi:hypothetical protein
MYRGAEVDGAGRCGDGEEHEPAEVKSSELGTRVIDSSWTQHLAVITRAHRPQ